MLSKLITALTIFALIGVVGVVYANAPQPLAPAQMVPQAVSASQDYCPSAEKLTKTDLFWNAPGGWVSYGESFDTKVTQFVKAEWIGINVGKIICIYKGDKRFAFPIALEQKHTKIVPSPTGHFWSKDLGGHKVCISQHSKDCPFQFERPKQEEDIYKGLDFFKGKSDNTY